MKKKTGWVLALALACTVGPVSVRAQEGFDDEGARQAALAYLEGFYEGDADKIRRGVHPPG